MDAQQFLAEFGHIANAPGGIDCLRVLVLQLAAQGKLVGPSDVLTSSSEILERVRKTRTQLVVDKKLPREKPYPSISEAGSTAGGPKHWRWAYFGEVWHLLSGRDLGPTQYNETRIGIPYITGASSIDNGAISVSRWTPEPAVISTAGDLLITCKGTIGKTAFNNIGDVHIARQIMAIRGVTDELDSRFLKIWLDGFVDELVKKSKSMIPGFSRDDLIFAAYPIFPLEEQSRIVAKVDELMALCDKLEKQQQDRRKLQNALRQSTLQALASAENPHELQESWQRLQVNFEHLFSEPIDTSSLKSLLLNLAMRGLLVNQQAGDTHSGMLLQQVSNEKARLIAAKKLKASTAIPAPSEADLPYALPRGWTWARVVDLVDVGTGATPAKSEPGYYGGDTPWYTSSATNEKFALKPETFITEKALTETNCKVFPAGSLIVAMYGQGKTRGQVSELVVAGATNQAIAALVFFESSKRAKRFLKYFFEKMYDEIRLQAEGGPQPNLSVGKIKEILVPVPPMEEQERIVARLDELFKQCNDWGSQLKQRDALARQFAALAVAGITGIANEGNEVVAVKAPQTELISPLCLGTTPGVKEQAPLATLLARHHGEMSARDLWQRFGGEIDTFYAQLKTEVAHGWIEDPSYELDPEAPEGPKKYPAGAQVAKMKIKQEA